MSWGSLSLRMQVTVSVMVPALLMGVLAAVFVPARLNADNRTTYQAHARALTELAANNLAFTGALGGAAKAVPPQAVEALKQLEAVDVGTKAGVVVREGAAPANAATPALVTVPEDPRSPVVVLGQVPAGEYEIPAGGTLCRTLEHDTRFRVSCRLAVPDMAAMLVSEFSQAELVAAQASNLRVGLILLALATLLGIACATFLTSMLTAPVTKMMAMAQKVAAGDVNVTDIQVAGGSAEINAMGGSINEMLSNIRRLVTQMVSLTGRLGGAAKGLIDASNDQEHVTSQQSAYAQEIAATFEELSRTAEKISSSTDVVEYAAVRTAEAVEEARKVVTEVVAGISNVRRESKEVAEAIGRLNTDLQQVSRIAQVINQVADRSDLLALNAALEGTKAGDVGRGFSLVAVEMRKLAESVAGSARDIGRLVEAVKVSGDHAVNKAREGVLASDRGVQVAEKAQGSFTQIAEFAKNTKEAAQQISVATRQQKESAEQAVQGARNVADLVKRGVDATGRTTKIAGDLQTAVTALGEVTSQFQTRQQGS